ncbi:MAG: ABC transporter, partial [Acetivibrio ethanolgignens]
THYMEEAAPADYVVILDSGKIVADGTPLDLKNQYAGDYVSIYGVEEAQVRELGMEYQEIRDGYCIPVAGTWIATNMILEHSELFKDYEITKGGMDDVFLNVTGKKLGGQV